MKILILKKGRHVVSSDIVTTWAGDEDEADDKADAWISENQPVRGDFSTCYHQL